MPSFSKIVAFAAGFAALASAAPTAPKLTSRQTRMFDIAKRQNAGATALGIADVDILQL